MNALKLNIHKNTLRTAFANEKKNKQKLQKVDGIWNKFKLQWNGMHARLARIRSTPRFAFNEKINKNKIMYPKRSYTAIIYCRSNRNRKLRSEE